MNETSLSAIAFPGKDRGETFQFFYRQHWMRPVRALWTLVVSMIVYGAILAMLFSLPRDSTRELLLVICTLFFILAHLIALTRFYTYFLYLIIVTDKKVHRIKKTLLAIDDHQSIDLWMIEDISKQQRGIVQNIFGFGTLFLRGQDTELRIHFTPKINQQHQRLMILREAARNRFGAGNPSPPIPGWQNQPQ